MAQKSSLVGEGVSRVRAAVRVADREFKRLQKQLDSRRKIIEKRFASGRRVFETRTQKQLASTQKQLVKVVGELRRLPLVQRAEALREDAARQFGTGVETVLGALQIASKGELERVDRKIAQLSRKLRDLEKAGGTA
jgi:hypothetical protein